LIRIKRREFSCADRYATRSPTLADLIREPGLPRWCGTPGYPGQPGHGGV